MDLKGPVPLGKDESSVVDYLPELLSEDERSTLSQHM